MKSFTENMKEVASLISKARDIMSQGPLDFYFAKLVEHSEALLTRFAPIKVGERAMIIRNIECKDGWKGSEKDLRIGATGEVVGVDYRYGKFMFEFVPDEQWYFFNGEWYRRVDRQHSYCLKEDELAGFVSRPVQHEGEDAT